MSILVCRQVCVTLTSDTVPRHVLSTIACELFKNEISWGRIISLYCVAGGLAVDCLRQGHPEYLIALIETMGAIVERDLAQWIVAQGGWVSFICTIHRGGATGGQCDPPPLQSGTNFFRPPRGSYLRN